MSLVHESLQKYLPSKRRTSPRGWIVFNAPCCQHRGHRPDTRFRGNVLFVQDGTVAYNCYNCGLKTVFDGINLSKNFENLLSWFGVPIEDIRRIKLEALNAKIDGTNLHLQNAISSIIDFPEVQLPEKALPFESIIENNEITDEFSGVLTYMNSRGRTLVNSYDYYYSNSDRYDLKNRVIIPFYYKNKIIGWTARYAGKPPSGTPRYYNSSLPAGYLFNCDALERHNRKYALIVEGPFDAIAVDGVATLGSELSKEQLAWLLRNDKEKIVVPDRQRNNQGLIDMALQYGWAVSFPDWEDDVKDAADAACKYGQLFTLHSIFKSKTTNQLQIGLKRRMFRS